VADTSLLPAAPLKADVPAARRGFVKGIDALEIGLCSLAMGAGRLRAEEKIDPAVGIEILAKPGDAVERGQPLARMHLRAPDAELGERIGRAFTFATRRPPEGRLVLERITARSG
jgi:pyrimidine-nucleoside phosphorylase